MKKHITHSLVMFVAQLTCLGQLLDPQINGGVRLLDETGMPMTNVPVRLWFDALKTTSPWDGKTSEGISGATDAQGEFYATHRACGAFGARIELPGYYTGFGWVQLAKTDGKIWIPETQKIEVILRKKESPIAMYARTFDGFILPATNQPVGYDLAVGDWVAPFGKGLNGDLLFTLHREFHERFVFKWDLTVQFPGEGNGWRAISPAEENPQSDLRYPRTAPAEGYDNNQMYLAFDSNLNSMWQTNSTATTNYFFRVRTQYDANNQLKSAFYGKLLGPIQVNVQGTPTAKLKLTYYLNPTSLDRNLEFDPKKNLFKNLPFLEQVKKP